MASLKMSAAGLEIIEQARQQKRWDKTAEVLCSDALTSKATLKRFWRKQPIQRETFIRICQVLGVESWEKLVESRSNSRISNFPRFRLPSGGK